jgi:hypothetical protein
MRNLNELHKLSVADKYIIVGQAAVAVGTLCVSLGTLLRLASSGQLPTETPSVASKVSSVQAGSSTNIAKDYFSI